MIHHIYKLQRCEASSLEDMVVRLPDTAVLPNDAELEEVCLNGLASMKITDRVDAKNRIYTVTIEANVKQREDIGAEKYVYVATAVSGDRWLIGSAEKPYPITTYEESFADAPGSFSGVTLQISYSATAILMIKD